MGQYYLFTMRCCFDEIVKASNRAVPMKALQADGFILKKNNVLIHESGIIASQCGYYQVVDGCETKFLFIGKKWWKNCQTQLKERNIRFRAVLRPDSPLLSSVHGDICRESSINGKWQYHEKVFVVTAIWDSNYHHFLVDTVLRFIRYLDFLKQHPEWKIHPTNRIVGQFRELLQSKYQHAK